mmetsp:Transcript_22591/g.39942  ORF Transcript_22591/g.39942 Transcript_22591/m.39942 type:complete len:318 (+) Transcript_22591:156-1109(+)
MSAPPLPPRLPPRRPAPPPRPQNRSVSPPVPSRSHIAPPLPNRHQDGKLRSKSRSPPRKQSAPPRAPGRALPQLPGNPPSVKTPPPMAAPPPPQRHSLAGRPLPVPTSSTMAPPPPPSRQSGPSSTTAPPPPSRHGGPSLPTKAPPTKPVPLRPVPPKALPPKSITSKPVPLRPPSKPVPSKPSPTRPLSPATSNRNSGNSPTAPPLPKKMVTPGMLPGDVPDCVVWEGRFTFRGNLPTPPRYTSCPKAYVGRNAGAKCPEIGDIIQVSLAPSPEIAQAAERDKKLAVLKEKIAAAGRAGDIDAVMELSTQLKELAA